MHKQRMARYALFLMLAGLLVAGCGGDADVEDVESDLDVRAEVAEKNLLKLRDAVVAYHDREGEAPQGMAQLDIEPFTDSDDYSDIAYGFQNVEFDEEGEMSEGWFYATPRADSDAYKVRLNGATGEFDYIPHDQDFTPAESDTGE